METVSLPVTLIILGALASICVQSQKISVLENVKKPSPKVNNLISSALQFSNFIMSLGVLLLLLQHYKALPPQLVDYEEYVLAGLGVILVIIAGSILAQKNVNGKVASIQLTAIGLVATIIAIKDIMEKKNE